MEPVEHKLLKYFCPEPQTYLTKIMAIKLCESHKIDDIFKSMFSTEFLQRIPDRQVFMRLFNTLETLCSSQSKSKRLPTQDLIKASIQMMFTSREKQWINSNLEKELLITPLQQDNSGKLFFQILTGIFPKGRQYKLNCPEINLGDSTQL